MDNNYWIYQSITNFYTNCILKGKISHPLESVEILAAIRMDSNADLLPLDYTFIDFSIMGFLDITLAVVSLDVNICAAFEQTFNIWIGETWDKHHHHTLPIQLGVYGAPTISTMLDVRLFRHGEWVPYKAQTRVQTPRVFQALPKKPNLVKLTGV